MAIVKCPKCNREVADNAECCPYCGTPSSQFIVGSAQHIQYAPGSSLSFGTYPYSDTGEERKLDWVVLANDGVRLLVATRYVIDAKPFNDSFGEITWAESSLRSWLNSEFVQIAFSEGEVAQILESDVPAPKNPEFETEAGQPTQDRIFCLSADEAKAFFKSEAIRMGRPTAYAKRQGLETSSDGMTAAWWLRTPGYGSHCASLVSDEGFVDTYGISVHVSRYGIRPCMWINMPE